MEIRQLQQFLAVVDCGSIGKAAQRLGIAQPVLTRNLAALERDVGASLFIRSKGGTALNQFGRALERRARAITIEAERATREIGEMVEAKEGRVVIASAPSFASTILLSHVLPGFRISHPHVQVVVIEGIIDRALPRIVAGEIDVAFGTVPNNFVAGVVVCDVVVPQEPVYPIAGSANPIAQKNRVTLEELQACPWALIERGEIRTRLTDLFLSRGLQPPEPVIVYDSIAFAKDVVRRGPYIAMLSHAAIHEELTQGTLRIIRAPDIVLVRDVGAFYRGDVALAPAAQALFDRVRDTAASHRRLAENLGEIPTG